MIARRHADPDLSLGAGGPRDRHQPPPAPARARRGGRHDASAGSSSGPAWTRAAQLLLDAARCRSRRWPARSGYRQAAQFAKVVPPPSRHLPLGFRRRAATPQPSLRRSSRPTPINSRAVSERERVQDDEAKGPPETDPRIAGEKHPVARMIGIGVFASLIGIAITLWIDWFPERGLHLGEQDRHALRRPPDLLGPGLRAGDDGRDLLRRPLPGQAGRHGRRGADPRQHPARGHLGDDPVPDGHRARDLRLDHARRHRGEAAERDGRERHRPAVHLDLPVPGGEARRQGAGAARGPPGRVQDPHEGRDPLVLGARSSGSSRTPCRGSPPRSA